MRRTDVAIVGGGISGLSVAWYLQRLAPALRYSVLERGDAWGGKIQTDRLGEFTVEGGPDSFVTQKPWGLELARELGLEDALLDSNEWAGRVFVLSGGALVPLPDGVMLVVPTKLMPFARSPLLSLRGKLRMAVEVLVPPRRNADDETLAEFIRRRLGSEALERIAEPLMAGVFNAQAERQSILATFPRMRALEEEHGSLTRGMVAARNGHSGAAGRSPFVTLKGGMRGLVDALVGRLAGELRLGCDVRSIERAEDGGYALTLTGGERLAATSVVLGVPAHCAAGLVGAIAPAAAGELRRLRAVSTGTISLAFRRADVGHPLRGAGVVIPRGEGRRINSITWSSSKFRHRAPADHLLLRVFFGGSRTPETFALDDERLAAVVRGELESIMGIAAEPVLQRIFRWHDASPQYDRGHLDRVAGIERALPPGLHVTGSPFGGVGIPDCVRQGRQVAERLVVAR